MAWLKGLAATAAVAAAAAGVMFYHLFNLPNERGTEVQLLIEKGAGSRRVAEQLAEAGVISHPLLFRLAARVSGLDKDLKAGEYVFLPGISMREVLAIISRGEVHYRRLTLPEGLTTARMLELIRAEPNLAGEITIAAEEGELLPETYSYVKGDSRDSIVRRARLAMEKTLEEAWRQNRRKVLKNRRQLLTLASIIEKETGVPEERADVAAVFINRLETGMKLQTDPTVIYALTKGKKDLGRPLYRKDLSVESPYNTYRYYGLPPGPICNPGREAIFAAVHPSDADYLYFVASGTGGHRFARSLKEHNRNVSLYKKAMKKK